MKIFAPSCGLIFLSWMLQSKGQKYSTLLDQQAWYPFSIFQSGLANVSLKDVNNLYRTYKSSGKAQICVPKTQPFFCDAKNGPGRRSPKPPESVNRVRPGDIDIIGAIGDSLTAANGAFSTSALNLLAEYRGISWSIGGRGNWRKFLTLPNILREFNSNLYGYSTADVRTIHKGSKFNVAEAMTMYEDMTFQTKILLKRMKNDPMVDMENHWKLITVFIGSNDICSKLCDSPNFPDYVKEHGKHVYATLRFLKNNFPKTIVNWVPLPNFLKLASIKNPPLLCFLAQRIECRCIFSVLTTPKKLQSIAKIIRELQDVQLNIVNSDEFHNDTFTAIYQPFFYDFKIPELPNGEVDLTYFGSDCFHFSQKAQATVANAIWNNMMQAEGVKQKYFFPLFQKFECPTNERPYIATRGNKINHTRLNVNEKP